MFGWLVRLFVTPWDVWECGCRFREHTFCPLELVRCEQHEREHREWLRKQPPQPPPEPDTNIYWCP